MFATKIPVSSLRPVTKRFYAAAATTGVNFFLILTN